MDFFTKDKFTYDESTGYYKTTEVPDREYGFLKVVSLFCDIERSNSITNNIPYIGEYTKRAYNSLSLKFDTGVRTIVIEGGDIRSSISASAAPYAIYISLYDIGQTSVEFPSEIRNS